MLDQTPTTLAAVLDVDPEDFTRPPFASPEDEAAFDQRGLELARRVAAAVGDRWSVRYRSATTGEVVLD